MATGEGNWLWEPISGGVVLTLALVAGLAAPLGGVILAAAVTSTRILFLLGRLVDLAEPVYLAPRAA